MRQPERRDWILTSEVQRAIDRALGEQYLIPRLAVPYPHSLSEAMGRASAVHGVWDVDVFGLRSSDLAALRAAAAGIRHSGLYKPNAHDEVSGDVASVRAAVDEIRHLARYQARARDEVSGDVASVRAAVDEIRHLALYQAEARDEVSGEAELSARREEESGLPTTPSGVRVERGERIAAARARVKINDRRGVKTERWIVDLANTPD